MLNRMPGPYWGTAQEANPFESLQEQIDDATTYLDVCDDVIERLKSLKRVLGTNLAVGIDDGDVELFHAYRSQFNGDRGPYKSGIRYHLNVNQDEVKTLSGWIAYKCTVVDIPYGDGKGGIVIDPKAYSESELERITQSFAKGFHPLVGEDCNVPTPNVNTGQREMNWIRDTYETLENTATPGVITGKALSNGGGEDCVETMNRSTILTTREAFGYLGCDIESATVAVQGYGNADSIAVRLVEDLGAPVIAVSGSPGGIYNPDGLDAHAAKGFENEAGTVSDCEGTEAITNEELLTFDVDLLVLTTLENAIDDELAHDMKADVIVETANGPLTPDADNVLTEHEIHVFPDILANAGDVTVSYLKWVQSRQRFYWTEQRVNDELGRVIVDASEKLVDAHESHDLPDFRTAVYVVVIRRVVDPYDSTGDWP